MSRAPSWYTPEYRASLRAARRDPTYAERAAAELVSWLESVEKLITSTIRPKPDGWAFGTYERFVLDRGAAMIAAPRPRGVRKGCDRDCFRNALHLALSRPSLQYVEGFACAFGGIVTEHAWCVDKDGVVVDPTWREPDLATYYGVVMDLADVGPIVSRNRVYGVLVNDWRNGSAVLRTGRVTWCREAS